ncbi:hypothetical protein [Cellulosimicrobium cellulans]|uniref:hypothetical protein n=1 Tax=Cellulosimicrobium cellulans TaxID=1710 RepID=UPI001BA5B03F|nr:hypothetical protein [Cellulosimicrobium cellulans]QUC00622.1 hypothetical protein J5A69_05155 [Cellulosimicrobium cellulans]
MQTTFSFNGGAQSITYWNGSGGETYQTYDDNYGRDDVVILVRDGVFGGDAGTDPAHEMKDWMREVHSRIEAQAYGVAVAATTDDVRAAVLASALGEPQPVAPADDGPVHAPGASRGRLGRRPEPLRGAGDRAGGPVAAPGRQAHLRLFRQPAAAPDGARAPHRDLLAREAHGRTDRLRPRPGNAIRTRRLRLAP